MKPFFTALFAAPLFVFLAVTPVIAGDPVGAMKSVVSLLPLWPENINRSEEPEASGVVIFDGSYILTALHVVDQARSILVRSIDGVVMNAELVGSDTATDLTLLKIEDTLPPVKFGDDARLGQNVCAIGNAFGLGLSLTCGTVSGIHRAGVGFNGIEDFVQTDAAVNPGASGGALVDADGRLLGILSAIFTKQSDANIGVNFAVSAPLAKRVALALKDTGRVGWAVSGLRLKPGLKAGAPGRLGARVIRVRTGSVAQSAGFEVGDLIVNAAGRTIRKPEDFTSVMAHIIVPGDLSVSVMRGNQMYDLVLTFVDQN